MPTLLKTHDHHLLVNFLSKSTLVEFECVVFVCVEKKLDCISITWGSHIMKSEPATHSLLCDTHVISETDMVCLL